MIKINKILKKYTAWMAALIVTGAGLSSCEKVFDEKIVLQEDFSNKAIVQVAFAIINASRNYVYVDGKQLSGSLSATGAIWPAAGAPG